MGPQDPFARGVAPDPSPDELDAWSPPAEPSAPRVASPAMLGFGIGVAFGLLALLTSLPQSLAVLAFGGLGALVGVGVHSLRQLSPDLSAAWAALVRSNDGGLPPLPGGRS